MRPDPAPVKSPSFHYTHFSAAATALALSPRPIHAPKFFLRGGKCVTWVNAEDLRRHKQRLEQTGLLEILDRDHRPIQVVHLSLSSVRRLSNLPFPSFSESLDNISTFFNIDQTEAYRLYQAADLLLRDDQIHAALAQIARNLARPASQP